MQAGGMSPSRVVYQASAWSVALGSASRSLDFSIAMGKANGNATLGMTDFWDSNDNEPGKSFILAAEKVFHSVPAGTF
jgi:hypothetical protein